MKVIIEIDGTPEEIAALVNLTVLQGRRPPKGWFEKNYVPASEEQKEDGEKAQTLALVLRIIRQGVDGVVCVSQ